MASDETRRVVDQLYDAYLGGDPAQGYRSYSKFRRRAVC